MSSTPPRLPDEERIAVGQIAGAWGLRGDLKVQPMTESPSRFAPGSVLYLQGRPSRVEASRTSKGGFLIRLDTVRDRTAAEALRGELLTVPQSEVGPPPPGSYYHFQIMGMDVWDEGEGYLGRIKEIVSTGANDVYVIGRDDRRDLLIPALSDVVLEVDTAKNRMVVRPPEGLLPR